MNKKTTSKNERDGFAQFRNWLHVYKSKPSTAITTEEIRIRELFTDWANEPPADPSHRQEAASAYAAFIMYRNLAELINFHLLPLLRQSVLSVSRQVADLLVMLTHYHTEAHFEFVGMFLDKTPETGNREYRRLRKIVSDMVNRFFTENPPPLKFNKAGAIVNANGKMRADLRNSAETANYNYQQAFAIADVIRFFERSLSVTLERQGPRIERQRLLKHLKDSRAKWNGYFGAPIRQYVLIDRAAPPARNEHFKTTVENLAYMVADSNKRIIDGFFIGLNVWPGIRIPDQWTKYLHERKTEKE